MHFRDLGEAELLAVAISAEEEDGRIYRDYAAASTVERAQLAAIASNGRERAVLALLGRQRPRQIAMRLGVSRNQVYLWMKRYVVGGLSALLTDASRPPGRKPLPPAKVAAIVNATLTTKPPAATRCQAQHPGAGSHAAPPAVAAGPPRTADA